MTDLRVCECASILLDILGSEGGLLFDGDAKSIDEILCKATLFSCLAKILAISTTHACTSHTSSKNRMDSGGPLFP